MHPRLDIGQVSEVDLEAFLTERSASQNWAETWVRNKAGRSALPVSGIILVVFESRYFKEVGPLQVPDTVIIAELFVALVASEPEHDSVIKFTSRGQAHFQFESIVTFEIDV